MANIIIPLWKGASGLGLNVYNTISNKYILDICKSRVWFQRPHNSTRRNTNSNKNNSSLPTRINLPRRNPHQL